MKKFLAIVLTVITLLSVAVFPAMASENITVIVDGQALAFDVPPQLINNRTMVPMRAIFEKLGATVDWEDATQSVIATKGDARLVLNTVPQNQEVLTVSDTKNNVGPVSIPVDVLPVVVDGRTLVPVRVISETLGCNVSWNDMTNTVTIMPMKETGVNITMYNPDGRKERISLTEIASYEKSGWFKEPVAILYAPDGRTMSVFQRDIDYHVSQGWYTEPVVTMYAADGSTTTILQSETEYYKAQGWYTAPVMTVYTTEGGSMLIYQSELGTYTAKGWYINPNQKPIYYTETNVPRYELAVLGATLTEVFTKDNGVIYHYEYTKAEDVSNYWDLLISYGWKFYEGDDKLTSEKYESTFTKGMDMVSVTVYWKYNEVWITYIK